MEAEYAVSLPFTDSERYDAILDDGESLFRVQVKTGRLKDGTVRFNVSDSRPNRTENKRKEYTKDEIDSFVVYCPKLDTIYWVPVEETLSTEMWLRVEEASKFATESRINWAQNYQLSPQDSE